MTNAKILKEQTTCGCFKNKRMNFNVNKKEKYIFKFYIRHSLIPSWNPN